MCQMALAAVDWFAIENAAVPIPIGVMGYGEGGLLALCSGTVDPRIDAIVVSGYFQQREGLWQEPIYRDVWGLVREFGDTELAGLIAPRAPILETSRGPEVAGPPPVAGVHKECACHRFSIAMRCRSVPGTSTNGFGRRPASRPVTPTC